MISNQLKKLKLPLDKVIVVGSGVMEELNLKESGDVDLCVTPELFEQLQYGDQWEEVRFPDGNTGLSHTTQQRTFEVMKRFEASSVEKTSFKDLRKVAVCYNDVWFLSPEYLLKWKQKRNRPKDRADVVLLQNYLETT